MERQKTMKKLKAVNMFLPTNHAYLMANNKHGSGKNIEYYLPSVGIIIRWVRYNIYEKRKSINNKVVNKIDINLVKQFHNFTVFKSSTISLMEIKQLHLFVFCEKNKISVILQYTK